MECMNDINISKQSKKKEIYDRLDELENNQKYQMELMEQRMAGIESKLLNLDSLCRDMEAILCFWMGTFTGEKGKFDLRGIATWQAEVENLKKELFNKEQESKELKRILELEDAQKKDLQEELIKQQETANANKIKIQKMEEQLNVEKTNQKKLNLCIEKYQKIIQKEQDNLAQKTDEAQNLMEQLKLAQEKADHLYVKNSELKQKIEEEEEVFGRKAKELEELKAREENLNRVLIQEKQKVKMYEDKFGCWKAEIKDYQELLKLVFECESLIHMMEDYKLIKINGPEDVANLIHFVNLLGDRASFLPTMYDYLEDYKERKREAVDQAEIKLFSCLNAYYRKNYEISSDLIRYPQEGAKFEQESMKDFDNRRKMFRSVECVYVPAVMRDEKTYLKLALVKGVL